MRRAIYVHSNCVESYERTKIQKTVDFLDETLQSLKLVTLMLKYSQPKQDINMALVSTSYTIESMVFPYYVIARLTYNSIWGIPANWNYDPTRLSFVYNTYDIPWDEENPDLLQALASNTTTTTTT